MYTGGMGDTLPPKRPRGRPPTGETPKRYLRMGNLWEEAAELAHEGGETTTALVTRAVEREVRRLRRHRRDITPGAPQGRDDAG